MTSDQRVLKNRQDAGKELGKFLSLRNFSAPIVLALPRGGIPVGHEVAKILHAPLEVLIARKIGAPNQPEYGIGAICENEIPIFNPSVLGYFDVTGDEVMATVAAEINELRRRIVRYRQGRELTSLAGKTVILVDDGLATGVTAAAAGQYLRTLKPREIILAVPVGPRDIDAMVSDQFDEIICLNRPINLSAIGLWYSDFTQVEDSDVMRILKEHHPDQSTLTSDNAQPS